MTTRNFKIILLKPSNQSIQKVGVRPAPGLQGEARDLGAPISKEQHRKWVP
jgi:hypothetical protein